MKTGADEKNHMQVWGFFSGLDEKTQAHRVPQGAG